MGSGGGASFVLLRERELEPLREERDGDRVLLDLRPSPLLIQDRNFSPVEVLPTAVSFSWSEPWLFWAESGVCGADGSGV